MTDVKIPAGSFKPLEADTHEAQEKNKVEPFPHTIYKNCLKVDHDLNVYICIKK